MKKITLLFITILIFSCSNENEKPNLLFILVDDLGWTDVSYNKSDYYETIHIDNLSEKETFQSQGVENSSNTVENDFSSNGLENFKFNEEETPELFNSDTEAMNEESSIKSGEDQISEEDDLEIPAFLRRQKN